MEEQCNFVKLESPETTGHVSERSQSCGAKCRQYLRENPVTVLTLLGILVGFPLGLAFRELEPSEAVILWIGMPGTLYMRLLQMTILPLVVSSVITGAASLDPKTNGLMGACVVCLAFGTNVLVCCMAAGLFNAIRPGGDTDSVSSRKLAKAMETHDVLADLLRNLIPNNMVAATFQQTVTKYIPESTDEDIHSIVLKTISYLTNHSKEAAINGSDVTALGMDEATQYRKVISHSNGINVLGLVTISAVFGIAAGTLQGKVDHFLQFMENSLQLVLLVVRWFFWLTPLGVMSLIAHSVAKVDDVFQTFSDLGLFVLTVLVGLVIHWTILLPLRYLLLVRRSPLHYFFAVFSPMSIAFASTSSAVAMPEMFNVCENKLNIDRRVSRLAIPVSITINGNGSAMFIVIASMFVTEFSGIALTFENTLVIVVLAIFLSMALPSVPSSSIFIVIIIMTSINVPVKGVAILFTVEWFLDRVRTAVNTCSHMNIVACTHALCKRSIQRLDKSLANRNSPLGVQDSVENTSSNIINASNMDGEI